MRVNQKKESCKSCAYYARPFVASHGPTDAKIMLVGDSPWKMEVARGMVFCGDAGSVLDGALEEAGLFREDVYIANSVKCQPHKLGEPYPEGVEQQCRETFLREEIEMVSPEIVVPMGNVAYHAVVGKKAQITKVRGTRQIIDFCGKELTIFPSFHPAYILRNPAHVGYLVNDLKAAKTHDTHAQREAHYYQVDTRAKFDKMMELLSKERWIACDIETTSLDFRSADILSIAFSRREYEAFVVTFYLEYPEQNTQTWTIDVFDALYTLLHSGKSFFFHNGIFDLRMLDHRLYQCHYAERKLCIDNIRWYDTQGMQGLLDENMRQSLKEIATMHTDIRYTKEELDTVHSGKMGKLSKEKLVLYNGKDVDADLRIAKKFSRQMAEQGLWVGPFVGEDYSDMSVAKTLYKMELFGAPVSLQKMQELRELLEEKLQGLYLEMTLECGEQVTVRKKAGEVTESFNPRSAIHIKQVLFMDLGLAVKDPTEHLTPTGQPSTDKATLEDLFIEYPQSRFLCALKLYRLYDAIYKTFIKGMQEKLWDDGRLRADFRFTKAVSGRILCEQPNLLNIPRDKEFEEGVLLSVREMFAARSGWKILSADFAQIEFKCCGYLSGDEAMIKSIFVDHEDFHDLVAKEAYPLYREYEKRIHAYASKDVPEKIQQKIASAKILLKEWRTRSKAFNFCWMFGGEEAKQAETLGVPVEDVHIYTDRIAGKYPKFWGYVKTIGQQAIDVGELTNPFGRKRRIPSTPDQRTMSELGRKASNFSPQSTAAYVGRAALVRIARRFEKEDMRSYPFSVIYDAILVESPVEEAKRAKEIMLEEMLCPVPQLGNHRFSVEIGEGDDWHDAEKHGEKVYTL